MSKVLIVKLANQMSPLNSINYHNSNNIKVRGFLCIKLLPTIKPDL